MGYVLAFAIDSDTLIRVAFWTGITAIVLTVLLVGIVIFLRIAWIRQQRTRRKVVHRWQPILTHSDEGSPAEQGLPTTKSDATLPPLPRGERLYFLEYWNYVYEKASLEEKARLAGIARKLGLDAAALGLADSDTLWRQLLGLETLGHLKSSAGIEKLKKYAARKDNVVSLTAARALMEADPDAAVALLMPFVRTRQDWAEPRVAEMLIEAGPARTGKPLAALFAGASPAEQVRLIHYAGAVQTPEAMNEVRALLARQAPATKQSQTQPASANGLPHSSPAGTVSRQTEAARQNAIIIAALGILKEPNDHKLIAEYLSYPDWRVREAAVAALGRIGRKEDEKQLGVLLHDEHWWVRYRAAKALARMPDTTLEDLERRLGEEKNPATQDVLRHVLAEEQLS